MSAHSRSFPSFGHCTPVTIALLGLLFVFLSSVTGLQASAAQVGHGFTGSLDHLLVASYHETLRVSANKPSGESDGEAGPDLPDSWFNRLVTSFTRTADGALSAAATVDPALPARFLTPFLRAPPSI